MALDQPFCVICFCDLPQPGLCPDCKKAEDERMNELNYFKAERTGIIYVCEASNSQDDTFFQGHKGPHVFFEIDADIDSALPACPKCGSYDNIYTHARAVLNTTEVLNEDEE